MAKRLPQPVWGQGQGRSFRCTARRWRLCAGWLANRARQSGSAQMKERAGLALPGARSFLWPGRREGECCSPEPPGIWGIIIASFSVLCDLGQPLPLCHAPQITALSEPPDQGRLSLVPPVLCCLPGTGRTPGRSAPGPGDISHCRKVSQESGPDARSDGRLGEGMAVWPASQLRQSADSGTAGKRGLITAWAAGAAGRQGRTDGLSWTAVLPCRSLA